MKVAAIHVGSWVVAITKQLDLIKWGIDGDTVKPYPPNSPEVLTQLKYLSSCKTHKDDRFYILQVFSNGQMRTDEYIEGN